MGQLVFRCVGQEVPEPLVALTKGVSQVTQHHVGALGGRDVVLLTLDPFTPSEFVITEIQTLKAERRKGFGSQALAYAEQFARDHGWREAKLHPKAIADDAMTSDQLKDWYEKAGYRAENRDSGEPYWWIKQL